MSWKKPPAGRQTLVPWIFAKLLEGKLEKASNIDIAEAIVQTLLDEFSES